VCVDIYNDIYMVAQKPVVYKNITDFFLLLTEFTKIVRNEILHIQSTSHKAVIQFYKSNGRFKSELPFNTKECFRLGYFRVCLSLYIHVFICVYKGKVVLVLNCLSVTL
jgi:hypothetical protein